MVRGLPAALRPRTQSAGGVTASEIYMRQSELPCSRKSAAPGGSFGSLALSNGAQPIDRAEFRPSLEPPDFALCRWCASLWFRRRAHTSQLAVISAVDLANGQGRGLGLAHRLESGLIASQEALCV